MQTRLNVRVGGRLKKMTLKDWQKMTFEDWQREVNNALMRMCGMAIDDLPDYDYWCAWEAGDEPEETAKQVIENAHGY